MYDTKVIDLAEFRRKKAEKSQKKNQFSQPFTWVPVYFHPYFGYFTVAQPFAPEYKMARNF